MDFKFQLNGIDNLRLFKRLLSELKTKIQVHRFRLTLFEK